jgi:hypothetical protein
VLVLAGCATGWDVDALAAREPGLAALEGQRLGDATPYALPMQGELVWLLCRFETTAPIRVALPAEASADERAGIERALRAWEQALALRFVEAAPAEMEIAFAPDEATYAATTQAECRVEPAAAAGSAERLPARIVYARVLLRRAGVDARGHRIALNQPQQLGALLHELGHALGYQGHARRGDTVMVRNLEQVRDVGRDVLAGRPFRDATLAALYAVPSGSVVARAPLPPGASAAVDRLIGRATREGDGSLWLRAGDEVGRVALPLPSGELQRVLLRRLPEALRDPARLELAADPGV